MWLLVGTMCNNNFKLEWKALKIACNFLVEGLNVEAEFLLVHILELTRAIAMFLLFKEGKWIMNMLDLNELSCS